jgi:hypothetical protein
MDEKLFDRHHILWQKRHWNNGFAYLLRNSFVRPLDISLHRHLHTQLADIPVPSGNLCKRAYLQYLANKEAIDQYDVARACAWLYVNIPDVAFRRAMQAQLDFFIENG